ncbi:adenosylcobinamide-GDP ribazoletransferase [Corynebacterium sp. 13CS0277]|uniref:adenosylcobinamide-GDP ribazoletransferase n=1 Tax=Corynebacterium sp. 13CS0277 TaxID=2071994 RepID=UPI000D0285B0|nr:adenosylcobinamide-GDP ribazoletransferase [Corynebacterium sp. 13CS0277]PRQ11121.1 adenosylcobinamide-GDP ribazoletransferase [Corynebacterium sp. 13CS0277]
MSGKAGPGGTGPHGHPLVEGISTALSWLSILPVRGAEVFDTITGRRAMLAMPVVGVVLGIVGAAVVTAGWVLGTPALLLGVLVVVSWELGTRMMHIDGLADVGDALGSYAPPAKAQEILADKYTGALGMGAVLLTLMATVSATGLLSAAGPRAMVLVALVPWLARIGALRGCVTDFHPIHAGGFGGLTIGTVPRAGFLAWAALGVVGSSAAAAWATLPLTPAGLPVLLGVYALLPIGGWLLTTGLLRHCARRFAGLNGDCLGAAIEVGTAAHAVLLVLATYALA